MVMFHICITIILFLLVRSLIVTILYVNGITQFITKLDDHRVKQYTDVETRFSVSQYYQRALSEHRWLWRVIGSFVICIITTGWIWYIATFTESLIPLLIVGIILICDLMFIIIPVSYAQKQSKEWGQLWAATITLAQTKATKQKIIAQSSKIHAHLCFNPHLTPEDEQKGKQILSNLEHAMKLILNDEEMLDMIVDRLSSKQKLN